MRRYIVAKRRWLRQQAGWRHTLAAPHTPGDGGERADDGIIIHGLPLPGSGGAYRVPWRRAADARSLRRARPDLIESADPYRLAWSALDAARALHIPAIAFCHSNLEQMAALAAGPR